MTGNQAWFSLHWGMFILGLFDMVKKNIIFVLFAAVKYPQWLPYVLAFAVAAPLLFMVFRYISMSYQMGDGHIRIREGLISKKIRSIPVHRIHNINTSQSLLARLLKVQKLDIETAGGGAAEASFTALSQDAVLAIQDFVRAHKKSRLPKGQETEDEIDTTSDQTIYKVTPRDLVIAGATTSRLGAIAVAVGAAYEYLDDRIFEMIPAWREITEKFVSFFGDKTTSQLLVAGTVVFLIALLVAWLISIASAFIRWHGFTLARSGNDLEVRSGLFTRHHVVFPNDKLQAMRLRASMFRRPFSLFEIRVQTAGHAEMETERRVESDMLMPITHRRRIDFFVRSVWKGAHWDDIEWKPVHPYTRSRQFRIMAFFYLVLIALLYFVLDLFMGGTITVVALILGLPLLWTIAHLTYRQTAYALDHEYIYIRKGFIGLHFWVIPVNRIQNVAVEQNPFQRRFGLGSLVVDVAGGMIGRNPTINNIPAEDCWALFQRLIRPNGNRSAGP